MITYIKDENTSPLTVKKLYEKLCALIANPDIDADSKDVCVRLEIDVRHHYDESYYSGVWRGMVFEVTAEFPSPNTNEPILKKVLEIETDEDIELTADPGDMNDVSLSTLITELSRLISEGKGDLICHGLIHGRDGSVNCDIQNVMFSSELADEHSVCAMLLAERVER